MPLVPPETTPDGAALQERRVYVAAPDTAGLRHVGFAIPFTAERAGGAVDAGMPL